MRTLPVLLLLAVGCSSGAGKGKAAGPLPDREGLTWGNAELLDHLKAKGVRFQVANVDAASAVIFCGEPDNAVDVRIFRMANAREARDEALGQNGFSWGRFLFVRHGAEPGLLQVVREALLGR